MAARGAKMCAFSALAHQVLVTDKVATVSDAAAALDLTYDALHARLRGRTKFRPAEVKRLIEFLDEPRLVRFFIDDSRHIVVRRPSAEDPDRPVRSSAVRAVREVIEIMELVVGSLESGAKITHRERAAILKEVKDAETAIANLRAAAEAPDRHPGRST